MTARQFKQLWKTHHKNAKLISEFLAEEKKKEKEKGKGKWLPEISLIETMMVATLLTVVVLFTEFLFFAKVLVPLLK